MILIVILSMTDPTLRMMKTHRSHDRLCSCQYFSHLLNLLPIT